MNHPVNVVVDHQRVEMFDIKHVSVRIRTWRVGGRKSVIEIFSSQLKKDRAL